MNREYTPDLVTSLKPHQVFVFGSNIDGFHGGGAAGYALRGDGGHVNWRDDEWFIKIVQQGRKAPIESRRGRWAVYGVGRGYQIGVEGNSYAIVTTQRPGYKGFVSLEYIQSEFEEFFRFASQRPDLEFFVTKMGLSRNFGGLSWFTIEEMQSIFKEFNEKNLIPQNVILPKEFDPR